MLNIMTLKEKPKENLDTAVENNTQALCDLLNCLKGYGHKGEKRIALFIKEVSDDAERDTGSL